MASVLRQYFLYVFLSTTYERAREKLTQRCQAGRTQITCNLQGVSMWPAGSFWAGTPWTVAPRCGGLVLQAPPLPASPSCPSSWRQGGIAGRGGVPILCAHWRRAWLFVLCPHGKRESQTAHTPGGWCVWPGGNMHAIKGNFVGRDWLTGCAPVHPCSSYVDTKLAATEPMTHVEHSSQVPRSWTALNETTELNPDLLNWSVCSIWHSW